jgi:hypothetical protein
MSFMDILKQYADPSSAPVGQVGEHFDQVAQQVPPGELGRGIAGALRSDATPPFGETVGNLFNKSNPQQQAGVLNQLIQAIGPGALSGIGGGVLGRILGGAAQGALGTVPTITPAQASQLSPSDVTAIANHAESQDVSIVDKIGGFYAQHPNLVKSMGAAALAIVLGKMHSR